MKILFLTISLALMMVVVFADMDEHDDKRASFARIGRSEHAESEAEADADASEDKRASFARIGRASFARIGKRASFARIGRASFARIGRSNGEDSESGADELDKRASFARIG